MPARFAGLVDDAADERFTVLVCDVTCSPAVELLALFKGDSRSPKALKARLDAELPD